MPQQYPFSAVVGSDDMALALILTAISPSVGGVLVRGEKGTAKSTMARALAEVLPQIEVVAGDRFSTNPVDRGISTPDGMVALDAPTEQRPVRLVELPVGATEDRVLGSLHLEKALSEGVTAYEPGLLARAHRGILYVDEVNLLHDHLVDLLLDAAAMGRCSVERDGVSVEHAAQFVLVGTMNPEEGELRPQLLDRFGLTVEVAAPRDPSLRAEVVRRRTRFEADPGTFLAGQAEAEAALRARIVVARDLIGEVELSDWALTKIAEVCAGFDVDGMRADIVTARASAAHAAWHGRARIIRDDIRVAARMALPHRRRRNPFDAPGLDEELLEKLLGDDEPDPDPSGPGDGPCDTDGEVGGPPTDAGVGPEEVPPGESGAGDSTGAPEGPAHEPEPAIDGASGDPADTESSDPADADSGDQAAPGPGTVDTVGAPYQTRLFTVSGTGRGAAAGRRSRAITTNGRSVGATGFTGGADLHLPATIRAAAPHQNHRGRAGTGVLINREDLRSAVREGRESNLVLFCVDASGSMAARKRMEQVKAAILSLLFDAYRRRDKVGLVTFRGAGAEVVLPPTSSVDVAATRLADLPAGGRTPLAEGLLAAAETLRIEQVREPSRRALLVVLTDGRATHGPDAVARSHRSAAYLAQGGTAALVVDCETGRFRMGLATKLATHLRAEHVALDDVTADALAGAVRARTRPRPDPRSEGEAA